MLALRFLGGGRPLIEGELIARRIRGLERNHAQTTHVRISLVHDSLDRLHAAQPAISVARADWPSAAGGDPV